MISALSVSRLLLESLPIRGSSPALHLQVLASFDRACNLFTAGGDVLALVVPGVGDGPLNVVIAAEAGLFAGLEPGMPARLVGGCLYVGHLEVTLDGAATWEPRPDWPRLRRQSAAVAGRLADLAAFIRTSAPRGSLLALLPFAEPDAATGAAVPDATLTAARQGAAALLAGWRGDRSLLAAGAACLAGLGGGLTPAGDDFLTGAMLGAWLAHPAPEAFGKAVLEAAAPRTTTLSAALLRAAAAGACSAPWHRLFDALAGGGPDGVAAAVGDVLAHGHTSGADALAGLLWVTTAR